MSLEPLEICRLAELEVAKARPQWLVDQLWGRAAVGFVGGAPKLGKTWLALDLALSVATDTHCLDQYPVCEPGKVLVYFAEDQPDMVRQRLEGLCLNRGLDLEHVPLYVITAPTLRLDLESDRRRLSDAIASLKPRLLVLDPLVRLHRKDENSAADVAELLDFLRQLQRANDLAILVVHHMRKALGSRTGQALRGSGDFHAWTDSALYLTAQRQRLMLTVEHRAAPAPEPIQLTLDAQNDGRRTHLAVFTTADRELPPQQAHTPLDQKILDLLALATKPLTRTEIRRQLRVNNQRLGELLVHLQASGDLTRSQHGWCLATKTTTASSDLAQTMP